jgi:hypothetical protein
MLKFDRDKIVNREDLGSTLRGLWLRRQDFPLFELDKLLVLQQMKAPQTRLPALRAG